MEEVTLVRRKDLVKARDCLMLSMISKLIGPEISNLTNKKFVKIFQATGERGALAYNVLETLLPYYIPGATLVKTKSYSIIELPRVVADVCGIINLNVRRLITQEDEELREATIDFLECMCQRDFRGENELDQTLSSGSSLLHYHRGVVRDVATSSFGPVRGRFISPVCNAAILGGTHNRMYSRRYGPPVTRSSRSITMRFLDLGTRGLSSEVSWTYIFELIKELKDFALKLRKSLEILNPNRRDSKLYRYMTRPDVSRQILNEVVASVINHMSDTISVGVSADTLRDPSSGAISGNSGVEYSRILSMYSTALTSAISPPEMALFKDSGVDINSIISPSRIITALDTYAKHSTGSTQQSSSDTRSAAEIALEKATEAFIASLPSTVRSFFGYDINSNLVVQLGASTHSAAVLDMHGMESVTEDITALVEGENPTEVEDPAGGEDPPGVGELPEGEAPEEGEAPTDGEAPAEGEEPPEGEVNSEAVTNVNIEELPPGVPLERVEADDSLLQLIEQMRREGAI